MDCINLAFKQTSYHFRVTAIFSAMNVQYFAYVRKSGQERDLALVKLRPSLIALKQFEQCYILARWIRILWTDIMERSANKARTQKNGHFSEDSLSAKTQVPFSTQINNNDFSSQPQITHIEYNDEWSETSPYSITDWSNMFLYASHDANSHLPIPNTLESHGLQFLANLGSNMYNNFS